MGDRKEREMVRFFHNNGWGAVRLGGSGSGTDRNLPDILAGDGGARYWGLEEKYSGSAKQIYVTPEKHTGLLEFCTRFGLVPLYGARFSTDLDDVVEADWRVGPATEPPTTDNGKIKLHHSVVQDWPLLSDLV